MTDILRRRGSAEFNRSGGYASLLGVTCGNLNTLVMRRTMDRIIASVFDTLKALLREEGQSPWLSCKSPRRPSFMRR
jgi:hypothetical protein